MKKILIITQQTIPHSGGLSTHIEILISELQKNEYETMLIQGGTCHLSSANKLKNLIFSFGNKDKFIFQNFNGLLKNLSTKIENAINTFNPDLIHSHDVYASYAALQTKKYSQLPPIIQTIHGPALYEAQMGGVNNKPLLKQLIIDCEQKSFATINQFIAVDSGQKAILVNDYNVSPNKIDVIFNGIDIDEIKRLSNNKIGITQDSPFFLVPRRLVKKTGVRYAIEALSKMQNENCKLIIAGQGPLLEELKQLVQSLKLQKRVHFLGAVTREFLIPMYKTSIGVIIPSVPSNGVVEATSLAVTEAMAAGTVPIASNIGGLAELIDNGETGLLFTPTSSTELAYLMDSLISDKVKRDEIIRKAYNKVTEEFSSTVWFQKIFTVYQKVKKQ